MIYPVCLTETGLLSINMFVRRKIVRSHLEDEAETGWKGEYSAVLKCCLRDAFVQSKEQHKYSQHCSRGRHTFVHKWILA